MSTISELCNSLSDVTHLWYKIVRLFRSKHFAHKSTSLQVEWLCPLQGSTSHGTVNLCLSCGGAPFIQRPKEQEWQQNRFASIKPKQLIAGQKNRMNPAGSKTTKRLYLKRCFIVLLMIQHIYSSKYLCWLLNIANVQFKFTCQCAAALSEYFGHRSSKNPTVPTGSGWRHWILHCILNSVCHISNADVH